MSVKQLTCFKSYDVRGELGVNFDNGIAYRIGRATAQHFSAGKIIVGRDARKTSPQLAAAVACGTISISKGQTEKSLVIMFAELVAATYLLRLLLRAAVRRAEERDARAFFSNASVSGTKY